MSAKVISFSRARGAAHFCIALIALIVVPPAFAVYIGLALALESALQSGFQTKVTLGVASATSFSFFLTQFPDLNLALIGVLAVLSALGLITKPDTIWNSALANTVFVLGFCTWHGVVWYSTSETGVFWFIAAFVVTLSSIALAVDSSPESQIDRRSTQL